MEDIYEENFRSFLAWVLFAKKLKDLTVDEHERVKSQLAFVCNRYNLTLPPGFNKSVNHCCMTYEDIPYIHRPLLIYVLGGLYESVASVIYWSNGFRKMQLDGVEYWHHPCIPVAQKDVPGTPANYDAVRESPKTPIVLFHGITSGWLTYLALIKQLGQNREVFMIDVDAIKMMSLCFEMPTPAQCSEQVRNILVQHKVDQAHVVGHSFGSITAGWFIRRYPDMVTHLTLIDPVSLLLGLPDVAYSFLYRKPSVFMEYLIYYFAAMEITVSNALRRHFWWYDNILWLEDIAPHISVVVGLAGNDEVTNPRAVQEYSLQIKAQRLALSKSREEAGGIGIELGEDVGQVEVVFWDGYSHGQCTSCMKAIGSLVTAIESTEKCNKKL